MNALTKAIEVFEVQILRINWDYARTLAANNGEIDLLAIEERDTLTGHCLYAIELLNEAHKECENNTH
jgi:hypothetical protein